MQEQGIDTKKIIVILLLVVVLGGAVMYVFYQGNKELDQIGRIICAENGYEFWYASGSTIRCYELNESTGIRTGHEFWIDEELCKSIYLGESQ